MMMWHWEVVTPLCHLSLLPGQHSRSGQCLSTGLGSGTYPAPLDNQPSCQYVFASRGLEFWGLFGVLLSLCRIRCGPGPHR